MTPPHSPLKAFGARWDRLGKKRYADQAKRLLITAEAYVPIPTPRAIQYAVCY